MDQRPKYDSQNYKILRRKHRYKSSALGLGNDFFIKTLKRKQQQQKQRSWTSKLNIFVLQKAPSRN